MTIQNQNGILRLAEPPDIKSKPKPKLQTERPIQRGFVQSADSYGSRGLAFAVNQRKLSRQGFVKMRTFVTNVLQKVGRFSVDRQSENFGVTKPVNEDLRLRPEPGQLADVFNESKATQRFNLNSYENTRQPVEKSVDNGIQVYETLKSLTENAYERTSSAIEVVKKSVDIIA